MRYLKNLRVLIQLVAFGTFVFQMQNSVRKYLDKPVVQQTSTTSLDNIKKPLLYVCQDGQFNYTESKQNGYQDLNFFTSGYNDELKTYTWKGKHGKRTFKDLQELLFKSDYSGFKAATNSSAASNSGSGSSEGASSTANKSTSSPISPSNQAAAASGSAGEPARGLPPSPGLSSCARV